MPSRPLDRAAAKSLNVERHHAWIKVMNDQLGELLDSRKLRCFYAAAWESEP